MAIALTSRDALRSVERVGVRILTTEQPSDADLVAAISRREEPALEAIFNRHGGAVQAVAKRVLRDPALAEDIVQDVFVSLWDGPGGFDANRGSLRTYLTTIAHRRAVDVVRSETARTKRQDRYEPTPQPDIDEVVWMNSLSASVREAVEDLSDGEKDAISLAYFSGLTYVEVANALGQPEGTVKSRIRSGMSKLRVALAGQTI